MRPFLENEVRAKQENWPGFKTKERFSSEIGTSEYARNYGVRSRWVPGIVSNKPSQRSTLVTSRSRVLHLNQLRRSNVKFDITAANENEDENWLWLPAQPAKQQQPQAAVVEQPILRRSNRARKSPERSTV